MSDATLLDPTSDARWARLVERCPDASIFHHPAWSALLTRQYRYDIRAVAVHQDGELVAGIPVAHVASRLTGRRLVALPFSDACAPLVAPGAPADAAARLAGALEAERERRGLGLEVRAPFPQLGPPTERFLTHAVDLQGGSAQVRQGYAPQAARNVRKAQRSGVSVELATGVQALDEFFDLLAITRRRLGVPTQPRRFVRALAGLFAQGLGFVGLARWQGQAAAAAVFLRTGTTLTYKYGGSDPALLHVRPNNALFDHVIGWACDAGLRTLDLGRSDLGQEGLPAFKRSWGAVEASLAYTYVGREPPAPGASTIDRVAGAIVRRSPPAVGVAIGAMLYRHVG